MTLTFNREIYGALLVKYQPKVIMTETENEEAIALAQELEHRLIRTPEEEVLLDLLVTLIERFENEHYPIPQGTPHSILRHLMEENHLKQDDLVSVIGSKEMVSEVVHGKRELSKDQANALAKFFNVDVELLS
jgi:HTH-type transcriptional regulator/antitoxin HigA